MVEKLKNGNQLVVDSLKEELLKCLGENGLMLLHRNVNEARATFTVKTGEFR